MSYHNWLKIVPRNTDEIQAGKVSRKSIRKRAAAVESPPDTAARQDRILEQQQATAKILVVGDGSFSAKLTDYAIKMGQRLDCEIVALSVFDKHCREGRDPGKEETAHFIKQSDLAATSFADKAASGGVKFYQLARVGTKESVVDQVVQEILGIRYILSEPDEAATEEHDEKAQLPAVNTTGLNV
jgi:hypothetical protein